MICKLFHNARIFTPWDQGMPARGPSQKDSVRFWPKGALLVKDGLIEAVGEEKKVLELTDSNEIHEELDCGELCLIPGFVDPHTHMCFVGDREEEFKERLSGASYLEILAKGGGILSTVRAVRQVSEEELLAESLTRALRALSLGTTTLEIKSGYGLETQAELKMLQVIRRLSLVTPLDVVPTFMGAHAVPEEYKGNPKDYVDLLLEEMLPAVSEQGIAKFCDVFCEHGVFSVEDSREVLKRASQLGLGMKIHAEEVHDSGGAALAAELGAVSAEHLLAASDEGLREMARAGVVAVLLPGTALSLKKPYARARDMVQMGVPVALATDCNPGSCYSESMPLAFALAVLGMQMSVEEALTASTLNASYAIGLASRVGSLNVGKQADFVLLEGDSPAVLAYRLGAASCIQAVYKRGEQVA